MLIRLDKSKLFTRDPALRFAKEYGVSPKVWNEIWKRYGLMEHDLPALCGYVEYKTGRKANPRSIQRWITRTELYCKANHIMRMGVTSVDSQYFGKFEQDLFNELSRNMRFNGIQSSQSIV